MFSRPTARWTAGRILAAIGIGGAGLYFAYLGASDLYAGIRADRWPTVSGNVLESQVQRVPGHGRVAPSYTAHFLYRYEVDRRPYTCDRLSFGRLALGDGEDDAKSLTYQYPVGSAVQVHYNPGRPDQAVLQPGWTWSAVLRTALGTGVVAVVLIFGGQRRGLTSA